MNKSGKVILSAIISFLIFSFALCSFSAIAPPYTRYFADVDGLVSGLDSYSNDFPNVDGYTGLDLSIARDGYHLENRQLYLIYLDGYEADRYMYSETAYGMGVNYISAQLVDPNTNNKVNMVTHLSYAKMQITREMNLVDEQNDTCTYFAGNSNVDGNSLAYQVCEYRNSKGELRCVYKISCKNVYTVIYASGEYDSSLIDRVRVMQTDVILPVYVENFRLYASGDVNCDGELDVRDSTLIQKYIAGVTELSPVQLKNGNVKGYGADLDIKDATAIQKLLAGLVTEDQNLLRTLL